MPGVFHQSVDRIVEDARAVADLGIPAQPRFALPHAKDWLGSQAWAVAGRDCRHLPVRITTHGHCGIPGPDDQPGFIDHDRSLELIARTAVAQVEAGADPVWRPTRVPDGPRQRAASCISRQRRVLNSQSGSPTRLAGREAGRAGSADLNRSRRRRLDHHLPTLKTPRAGYIKPASDSERSAWNSLRRWKTTGLRVLLWRDG